MSWRPYITRRLPIAILFIAAIVTIANYFVRGVPELNSVAKIFSSWAVIIFSYSLGVGVLTVTLLRSRRLLNVNETNRRRITSALFLAELWIVIFIGVTVTTRGDIFKWISTYVYATLRGAQFAMIGFYMPLACYRTLKVRRWDIAIFSIVCFIHLVGTFTSITVVLANPIFLLSQWLFFWPVNAGNKGLTIIAAVGIIAVGIRGILGMERGILGGGGE